MSSSEVAALPADTLDEAPAQSANDRWAAGASYAWLVLGLLALTNVLSFMDRYLINIVAQPIKEDMGLTDAQVGLLTGFATTLSYSVVGLPLARLAERVNRVWIIAGSVTVWSIMTAVSGRAANFVQLLLYRAGVGVGEAGAGPASQSLIADYFPPDRRGTAFAIFSAAIPVGALIGAVTGGWIIDNWSWREAFVYLGWPGVIVAAIFALLVKETPRGTFDERQTDAAPPLLAVMRRLVRDPVSRHLVLGYTGVLLVTLAAGTFFAPFLARKFAINYTTIGLVISLTTLGGGIVGNLLGGVLADRLSRRDRRWVAWVPAIGLSISVPFYFASYLQPTVFLTAAVMLFPAIIAMVFMAPTLSALHARTDPRSRSTMIALVGLFASLFGGGLGPFLGGTVIDLLSEYFYAGSFALDCMAGSTAPSAAADTSCADALLQGTTLMLLGTAPLLLWPAAHYFRAARHMKQVPA